MSKSRGCRKSQLGSTWKNHGRNVFVGFVSWTIDETSYIVMGKYANMMFVWNILPLMPAGNPHQQLLPLAENTGTLMVA